MRKNFIREKKINCGKYREVDIIPRTRTGEEAVKGKRKITGKETVSKQKDLNDKNARRYLVQLGCGNFDTSDLHITYTYNDKHLPASAEEAEKIIANYLKRIAYRRKKLGLEPLKYILVTECAFSKDGSMLTRIHHHVIMNGGLSRDEVEVMWSKDRINWKKYKSDPLYQQTIKLMGWVNADRLQLNENGIEALCKYITKNPQGKKRWSSSRNLIQPNIKPNDSKYSKREVERLAKDPDILAEIQKRYLEYDVVSARPKYFEETGWHIYLKMWKKPQTMINTKGGEIMEKKVRKNDKKTIKKAVNHDKSPGRHDM